MKFGFTADIHLSGYSNDKIVNQLPERLDSIKKAIHAMAEHCIEDGIKTIVIGGDILHGKSMIHAMAQYIMLDYFRSYRNELDFIVIDGNHDLSGKGTDVVSALESIDNEPNVNHIRSVEKIENILFVPYSHTMIDDILSDKADYLVSHFGLNEGILNNGMSIIDDMGISKLRNKYKTVLLGHYHKPQEILEEDIRLYYVGSPIQMDWGEKNEEKRFLIVDTTTDEISSVPTVGYKKYCEFELNSDNIDDINKYITTLKTDGHDVRLVKKDKEIDTTEIEKDFIVLDKSEQDFSDRGISASMSQNEKMLKFLAYKNIKETDKYIKIANQLIEESS